MSLREPVGSLIPDALSVILLKPIEATTLLQVRRELSRTQIPWTVNYSDYHSNGWFTSSLINSTGKSCDTTLVEAPAQHTSLLRELPATKTLIESLGLDVFWARFARLEPNSYLWEHIDYTEFTDDQRLRIHIPIHTNPRAEIVFTDHAIHLSAGQIWALDPKGVHGAANRGLTPRVHLILDCHVNRRLANLVADAPPIPAAAIRLLPTANEELIARIKQTAGCLFRSGYYREGEHLILKLFHNYHLPEGKTLDLLLKLYQHLGEDHRAQDWAHKSWLFLRR